VALTFKEYAKKVLSQSEISLTPQEIWEKGKELGLDKKLNSKGKTPWNSIGGPNSL
jgi:hypothetical protein